MRVRASVAPTLPATVSAGPGRAAAGFSLDGATAPARLPTGPTVAAPAGLLALQDVAPPASERRRRAVGRGRALLGLLDGVRLGLLEGAVPESALRRLQAELARRVDGDDDAALRALLDAIDARAAVEAAKLEVAAAAG